MQAATSGVMPSQSIEDLDWLENVACKKCQRSVHSPMTQPQSEQNQTKLVLFTQADPTLNDQRVAAVILPVSECK